MWPQVRDRIDAKATAIADACELPLVPAARLGQLPAADQERLRSHLVGLVAAKRERAAERERNKARRRVTEQEAAQEAHA